MYSVFILNKIKNPALFKSIFFILVISFFCISISFFEAIYYFKSQLNLGFHIILIQFRH